MFRKIKTNKTIGLAVTW